MDEQLTFDQGYICAVATLVAMHGNSTEVRNVLGQIDLGKVDWSTIAQYDIDVLREAGLLSSKQLKKSRGRNK